MSKTKELEIHTVIVDGDASSFKAALSRSILGVSWVKFKRRKHAFYQHRVHNLAVTSSIFNWLYETLLTKISHLSTWKLKTDLKPLWNENGKINALSDVTVSVYMKIGELRVKKLEVYEEFKNVKIDFFYSETDFASQSLKTLLPQVLESIGRENFDYHRHNFSESKGKEMAKAFNVTGTPTVVINAEKKLENPTEKELRQEIERAFAPMVKPSEKPEFIWDSDVFKNANSLCELEKIEISH